MDFFEKIKNYLFYVGFEPEQFHAAKEQFFEPNRKILMGLSSLLGTVGLVLALSSCFMDEQVVMVNTFAYLCFTIVNYGMCFVVYKFGKLYPKMVLLFCYVVLFTCYAIGIYAGCSHGPDRLGVSIVGMVVILPIIFYDYPMHLVSLDIVATATFLSLSASMKNHEVFVSDVVNVLPFTIVGCMLCFLILRAKVSDLLQKREVFKQSGRIEELNVDLLSRNSKLEEILEQERLNNSIIKSLGNSFYAIYLFDLHKSTFKEVKSIDPIRKLVGTEGDARKALHDLSEKMVASEDKSAIRYFTDFETMQDRLRGKNSIAVEYLGQFSGWSRALIIPISMDADGSVCEAMLCVRSIAEEKKAQLRQESIQKLNESINSGLWTVEFDSNGEVSSCYRSETYRRMLGYSSLEEFPNTIEAWNDCIHPDEREFIVNAFWTAIYDRSDNIVYDVEYRARLKSGQYHWFHAAGRVTRRADGTPISMIGVFIDINNQKEMERQLDQQQATLRDAFVTAQQASAAKSAFLNNMSHDIRTPLNAILGFSGLAESHLDDVELTKSYLSKISTAGRHLLELVNDVLDMSRIESGKVKIDEAPTRISSLVNEIETIVHDSAADKKLSLSMDVSLVQDDCVFCDKLRLNQVLLNLLGNSIKFSREGGHVSLKVIQDGAAVNHSAAYEILVEDDGIGMSEEFKKRVFEPFEREKSSTVSGIQGTGLGLAICKNIVNMMGGTIKVESESGKGTKFTVSLNLKLVEDAIVENEVDFIENLPAERFKGLKVLLVEDNELNSEIAQSILEEAGFIVDAVNDGTVAVERIRTAELGQYDVILMDVQMPLMNGYEATRQIRAMHRSGISSLPIIAVTANAFDEDRLQALQAGMDGYVSKPIEIPKFMATLKAVLR